MKLEHETVGLGPMELADVPQVAEIERMSFPLPWSAHAIRRELAENANAHFLVAYRSGDPPGPVELWARWLRRRAARTITGYIGYWYIADEAHISTVAVHPEFRRQRIGDRLLTAMLRHAGSLGATLATLEVRASNLAAQALYRKHGFEEVGRRRGYYRDNDEDALLMTVSPLIHAGQADADWSVAGLAVRRTD